MLGAGARLLDRADTLRAYGLGEALAPGVDPDITDAVASQAQVACEALRAPTNDVALPSRIVAWFDGRSFRVTGGVRRLTPCHVPTGGAGAVR